jgi:hypothetical protein
MREALTGGGGGGEKSYPRDFRARRRSNVSGRKLGEFCSAIREIAVTAETAA